VEPILDESSLVPCKCLTPAQRIQSLAMTMRALDNIGVTRVLRSVRDAADRDIGEGRGLRNWCFEKRTDRDSGRFLANRLDKQPFIDGENGLFAVAEGNRAVEIIDSGQNVYGLGLAALTDGLALAMVTDQRQSPVRATLEITTTDGEEIIVEQHVLNVLVSEADVTSAASDIPDRVLATVRNGSQLLERFEELFPRLRLGQAAYNSIAALHGSELVFNQLRRHLRMLDSAAKTHTSGSFTVNGVSASVESQATLNHGVYGPQRDFPAPKSFEQRRWSWHTKFTGGHAARLYYDVEQLEGECVVLIGYFGKHLPTVNHR